MVNEIIYSYPSKEAATYKFYKKLFPNKSSGNPNEIEIDPNVSSMPEVILLTETYTKSSLNNTLENYLKEKNNNYDQLNLNSFSSHFLSSLLSLQSNFSLSQIILKDNNIIGLNNETFFQFYDIVQSRVNVPEYEIQIKNILFSLKDLMNKPIDINSKNQFIQHSSSLFFLKRWYLKLVKKDDPYSIENQDIGDHPLVFNRGWITSMIQRFKKIQLMLIQDVDNKLTHNDLFKEILPYTSLYYELLSRTCKNTIDINGILFNDACPNFKNILNQESSLLDSNEVANIINQLKNNSEIPIKDHYQDPLKSFEVIKEIISSIDFDNFNFKMNIFNQTQEQIEIEKQKCFQLKEFFEIVLECIENSMGTFEEIKFSDNMNQNKYFILFNLLKLNVQLDFIKNVIKVLKISKDDVNNGIINSYFSIVHSIIRSKNENVLQNIEFLYETFNLDLEYSEPLNTGQVSPIDLAAQLDNHQLVKFFIALGACRVTNGSEINRYYKRLEHNDKLLFEPYLKKTYEVNSKINWKISLDQLFPFDKKGNANHKLSLRLNEDRVIKEEYWETIYDEETKLFKDGIKYGASAVTLIKDEYGNGIYLKFDPQLHGTEICTIRLSKLLFGTELSPYCELGNICDRPVLLIQQVVGQTLFEAFDQGDSSTEDSIIKLIDKANLSEQMIMSILCNNADSNLADYILKPIELLPNCKVQTGTQFRLYSIDNDQSFIPNNPKISVNSVMFLLKQMHEPVHKDVIERIRNVDIKDLMLTWIQNSKVHHQTALDLFDKQLEDFKKHGQSVIGIVFPKGMIRSVYSKLQYLQEICCSRNPDNAEITHWDIFELLEPHNAERVKPIFELSSVSLFDKFLKLKTNNFYFLQDSKTRDLTKTYTSTADLLAARGCPILPILQNDLKNGTYGPDQAYDEFIKLKDADILQLIDQSFKKPSSTTAFENVTRFNIENFLKNTELAVVLKTPEHEKYLIDSIKSNDELVYLNLKKSTLDLSTLKQFKFENLAIIELSDCNNIDSISGSFFYGKLNLDFLKQFKINNCKKLHTFDINAPKLEILSITNTKTLKKFKMNFPNKVKHLNLSGTIDISSLNLFRIEEFTELESLNISKSTLLDSFTTNLPKLKVLNTSSIDSLKKITLKLPSIKQIIFDQCLSLKEIFIVGNENNDNIDKALSSPKNIVSINQQQINILKVVGNSTTPFRLSSQVEEKTMILDDLTRYIIEDDKYYAIIAPLKIIPSNIKTLIFCKDFNQSFDQFSIPNHVETIVFNSLVQRIPFGCIPKIGKLKHLVFSNNFNQVIEKGLIPDNIKIVELYNITHPLQENCLPQHLSELILHDEFIHKTDIKIIPSHLKYLKIFDQNKLSLINNGQVRNNDRKVLLFNKTRNDFIEFK